MSDKLLPCPFCGGNAVVELDDNLGHWIECSKCVTTGPTHSSRRGAFEHWNRRATDPAPAEQDQPLFTASMYGSAERANEARKKWEAERACFNATEVIAKLAAAQKDEAQGVLAKPIDEDLRWLRKAVYSYPQVEAQHALHRVEQALEAVAPMLARVPDGYVIVPKEPTFHMLRRAETEDEARAIYKAMLAAAPQAAPQEAQTEKKDG